MDGCKKNTIWDLARENANVFVCVCICVYECSGAEVSDRSILHAIGPEIETCLHI